MTCEDEFPRWWSSEIWLNVFDKLDRTDKLAFSGASSVWHDWGGAKRTESLISEVAPQLIETFHSENLLLGRELCQSWKEELEYKIQTNPSHTSLYFEIDSGQHWIPDLRSFRFRSVLSTEKSGNEEVEGPVRDDDWTAYWTSVFLLLDNFGPHVHFADIWFSEWNELQPEQLTMDSHTQSVAALEHLETVQLNSASPALVGEVVNSCCVPANIKRLSYQHGQWHAHRGELPEVVYSFVNLKVLQATIYFRCFERLASLERRPPLRELHLTFEDAPYFEDVFSRLEIFAETLIQDSNGEWLDGREKQFLESSSIWSLMPCLQKLRLGCGPFLVFERPVEERLGDNSVENWDTEGLEPRTWSQDLRLVVTEVMISLLLDHFAGSLF
ncbi:hypothetical protein Ocin01_19004 [Orchesella cincta]|uniref:Uncharacterized protein n=1 Tax=Orchesella cincta TaxID=48709 RepID=A0A1D2M3X2_ORCCI|nr:hypothetical protein Ocin01_19004 [Orchesella cincta]